tara:strand:- start:539 stop:1123 length:585 start_codon:yes stop_codon:yes gene_type:complete
MKKNTYRVKYKSKNALLIAQKVILDGGIIVYPTDTLYGFGVDARNELAISKLNQIKGRKSPISVIMHDKNTVFSCIDIPEKHHDKINKYLIGKSTIILKVKSGVVHSNILGENKSLGIRIPEHSFGPRLCEKLGFPITTTSVNRTGETPLNDPNKIIKVFDGQFDLLIDDGILEFSHGSTIYKFENSKIKVLRK